MRGNIDTRFAVKPDRVTRGDAAAGILKTGNGPQQGRFATAAWPEQRGDPVRRNRHLHIQHEAAERCFDLYVEHFTQPGSDSAG